MATEKALSAQLADSISALASLTIHSKRNKSAGASSIQNPQQSCSSSTNHQEKAGLNPKQTRRKQRIRKNKFRQDADQRSISLSSLSSMSNSPVNSKLPAKYKAKSKQSTKPVATAASNNVPAREFKFSIKPANVNKKVAFFIKKRTSGPFINLRSFVNTSKTSCEFVSTNPAYLNNDSKSQKRASKKDKKKKVVEKFPDYYTEEAVKAGLSDGSLVKGIIRINPKNAKESYVNNEDKSLQDYVITSVVDRNRALEGDEVVLRIKPKDQWTGEKGVNKTATVVFIKEKVNPRQAVGILRTIDPSTGSFAAFTPRDKRFPIVRVSELNWPTGYKEQPDKYRNILVVAKILEWDDPQYAVGIITETIGSSGDLKIETLSILKEFCLDITPFSDELKQCVPQFGVIPEKEFEYREDLRKKCIFTIDPLTARDLDDAVSAELLPNGNYEIGVHISDASYYLHEGTELDQIVSKKATTIYMVDSTYHMLPYEMCTGCSLLPGEDKLSFSVFWEFTTEGEVLSTRFARTVMNSCAKLAYEHAQNVIDDREISREDFPTICNGFQLDDLVRTINVLQGLAKILRERRFRNGALRIDNVKLSFELNPLTGKPEDFSVAESLESHRLIEEFMLLANISVAQKLLDTFPELAFLRRHEPPKETMLVNLQTTLAEYGVHLNINSAADIQVSLKKYCTNDAAGQSRAVALNHLTAKPMTRAKYFCAATAETSKDLRHYALNIPIYTHFTSPIRRYADIMVHRLLAASLEYCDPPQWDVDYVQAIANNCNTQKYQAKKAQDASMELYLAHYIDAHKPFVVDAVVVDVKEKKIDVVVLKTGTVVRIYHNNCEFGVLWEYDSKKVMVTFPKNRKKSLKRIIVTIELFSVVKVSLKRKDYYHLEGRLMRPKGIENNRAND
ncbi:unnamed protein product [Phyllotreta striolata]|uniref:RNB domain-containing protein n=1 Tax=Phyllotreta striolata TaxID=444603 RepID=A0A9N9XLV3_PHYSR|nr:unnamed protein product [Phyllotreta striolata]